MNKPTCRLCGHRHWHGEPHQFADDVNTVNSKTVDNVNTVNQKRVDTQPRKQVDMVDTLRAATDAIVAKGKPSMSRLDALESAVATLTRDVATLRDQIAALSAGDRPKHAAPVDDQAPRDRKEYQREYQRKRRAKFQQPPAAPGQ